MTEQVQETSLPVLPPWKILFGTIAAFFALAFLVYGFSLGNDFVRWDDGLLIYENTAVREISLSSLKKIFTTYDPELYIPLTLFSYQIDYQLGGADPFVYHFHNLLLHTVNALLVTWIVFLLGRSLWVALFVGVFFAIHPLHTEAVAWASARKDVLSALFFLLSLIGYMYYRQGGQSGRRLYVVSVISFLLGLLSKVMVITLPVVLLLLDYRVGRRGRGMLVEKVPYVVFSVIFGIVALFGKKDVTMASTLLEKILMACKSMVFYLTKIALPTHLSVLYPHAGTISITSADFFVPLAIVSVLVALVLAARRRRTRESVFAASFFLVTLFPTFINFANGGDYYFASDRYAYLPSIGILYLVGFGLKSYFLREEHSQARKQKMLLVSSIALAIAVLFSALTFVQAKTWKDSEALFRNVLLYYPNSHRARNNLGNVYRRQGKLDEAISELRKAVEVRETAKTLSNLGAVYRKKGMYAEAFAQYERALQLEPESAEPHFGLGIVYVERGQFDEAVASYKKALEIDPEYTEVLNNLGALYVSEGLLPHAIEEYRKAVAIDPYYIEARYNLAVAFALLEQFDEAMREYEEVIRLQPDFVAARINLGILYYNAKRFDEAISQFRIVLTYDSRNARALSALEQMGEL